MYKIVYFAKYEGFWQSVANIQIFKYFYQIFDIGIQISIVWDTNIFGDSDHQNISVQIHSNIHEFLMNILNMGKVKRYIFFYVARGDTQTLPMNFSQLWFHIMIVFEVHDLSISDYWPM